MNEAPIQSVPISLKDRLTHHYYRVMPNKKHHRVLVWVVFLFVSITLGVQMAYPLNRAVPFATLAGKPVGAQLELDLAKEVSGAFPDAKVKLRVGDKTSEEIALVKAGAQPNTDAMVKSLVDYPFWQRFIPGSLLWQRPSVAAWSVDYSPKRLNEFATLQAEALTYEPTSAGLAIRNGLLVATGDKQGTTVTAAAVSRALIDAKPQYGGVTEITPPIKVVPATQTMKDLASVRTQAESALALPIVIYANNQTFIPSQTEKASWLRLAEDENGKTTLTIDQGKLNNYIDNTITKQVGKTAGKTNITLQNGRETARQVGESGLKVNNQPLVDSLSKYLMAQTGRSPFVAEMVTVEPGIMYNNSYTATQEGLQAYIAEKAKHGAWISVKQLNGAQWAAGADDHDSVVSGSTYKLYVSLYLFKEMDAGRISWDTPILDTNTDTCFNRMTIASTNPCAEEWLRQFGRSTVNSYLYEKGFSTATTFTHPEASHTSAADLTKYMTGLEQGTLINGAHRDRLLYSLSHHPYRYGIPAGSGGEVWDKVGFVFDYINDTAIVHHPRGTYILTIMTKGQSYAAIATMTREIEKIMYP